MRTLLYLSLVLPLLGGRLWTKASGSNPRPDGPVTSYEYRYSGTMRFPLHYYELKRDDAGALCLGWSDGEEEIFVIRVPEDALERIGTLVRQYKLHKLKNSSWPRMEILDGYGWHVYIRFQKDGISSGGTNAWPPEKLDAGIAAINGYLRSLIDASTEADILRVESHLDR